MEQSGTSLTGSRYFESRFKSRFDMATLDSEGLTIQQLPGGGGGGGGGGGRQEIRKLDIDII